MVSGPRPSASAVALSVSAVINSTGAGVMCVFLPGTNTRGVAKRFSPCGNVRGVGTIGFHSGKPDRNLKGIGRRGKVFPQCLAPSRRGWRNPRGESHGWIFRRCLSARRWGRCGIPTRRQVVPAWIARQTRQRRNGKTRRRNPRAAMAFRSRWGVRCPSTDSESNAAGRVNLFQSGASSLPPS